VVHKTIREMSKYMSRVLALAGVTLVVFAPSAAFASGSSTCQAYNPQLCSSVGSGHAGTGTSSSSAGKSGTLPFTGLDVVLLLGGAVTLVGAGLVVRGLARRLD